LWLSLLLLAALLLCALPVIAQPPADAATLSITVLKADGTPLQVQPKITGEREGGGALGSPTRYENGTFTYESLVPGSYHLALLVKEMVEFEHLPSFLTADMSLSQAYTDQLTVTIEPGSNTFGWPLPAPATLTIKVTEADGGDVKRPLALYARGALAAAPTYRKPRAVQDNIYTYANLYPGRYTL
jgi:hypothetical protein